MNTGCPTTQVRGESDLTKPTRTHKHNQQLDTNPQQVNQPPEQQRTTEEIENNHSRSVDQELINRVQKQEANPWEAQTGWLYIGHGEWAQGETQEEGSNHGSKLEQEPMWVKNWLAKQDDDVKRHEKVWEKGYPNRWGARIRVDSAWSADLLKELLQGYEDAEVVEWIRYGWPSGRLPTLPPPGMSHKNHKGATEYPEHLKKYISKELSYGAVMGPYHKIPFKASTGISPLSTRPKKGSEDRRVILDLSFPIGKAVNDGIPKDSYLGFATNLTFPKTDEFAFRIFHLGPGCAMFKIDLSRYFRQIPLDPGDYPLIGYVINGEIYFDKVMPMGMRSAPYIAQRITNAISFIHRILGFFLLNYVDDFVAAEIWDRIWEAYNALTKLLHDLRVETSKEKIVPPTTRLEFLGITFDSEKNDYGNIPRKTAGDKTGTRNMVAQDISKKERSQVTGGKVAIHG